MAAPHTELTQFALPCHHPGCTRTVDFHSDRHKDWLDFWLDGVIAVFCPAHRARST